MHKTTDHLYIFVCVLLTVYSQLMMRWQVSAGGLLPEDLPGKLRFVTTMLLNPWVLSAIVATFLAGIAWMLAMAKFEVSYAFPFMSLNYVLVLAASVLLFQETFTGTKLAGTALIIAGIVVLARG
jgi:drug/metabolite transporter (DMT)-like permease